LTICPIKSLVRFFLHDSVKKKEKEKENLYKNFILGIRKIKKINVATFNGLKEFLKKI
jgi:hypothetical protein